GGGRHRASGGRARGRHALAEGARRASHRRPAPRRRGDRAAPRPRRVLRGAPARDDRDLLALLAALVRRRPARAPRRGRLALRGDGAIRVQHARRARRPEPRLVHDVPVEANAEAGRLLRARAAAAGGTSRGAVRSRCEEGRRRARAPSRRNARARPRTLRRSRAIPATRAGYAPRAVQLSARARRDGLRPSRPLRRRIITLIVKVVMARAAGRTFTI